MLVVVGGVRYVGARRVGSYPGGFEGYVQGGSRANGGEADAVSVAPPSYQEKDKDVEGEGEWEERVRAAV
jgi:hypothetical protein